MFRFQIIVLLGFCFIYVYAQDLVCSPGVCRIIQCPRISACASNQVLIRRAVRCRCCSVCVPLLKLGEPCLRLKRNPAVGRCMRGLRCLNRRCSVPQAHYHRGDHPPGPKCGRPGWTANNNYEPSGNAFNVEDVVRYACTKADHVILGSSHRKCQNDGFWSDDIPVCYKVAKFEKADQEFQGSEEETMNSIDGNLSTCSEAPKRNQTAWIGSLSNSTTISAVQISILGIRESNIDVIITNDDSPIRKTCSIKRENTEISVKSTVTLTFYCPDNTIGKHVYVNCYNQALRLCEVSALLSAEPSCLSPDSPLHGTGFKRVQGTNSVYQFTCKDGYQIQGELLVTCESDGRWSPKSPICIEIYCFAPNELENGNMEYTSNKGKIPFNGTVRYACNEGFYLDGPSIITCIRWNVWNFPEPVCKPMSARPEDVPLKEPWRHSNVIHCGNLPHIANGALIVNSSSVGSIAWLKCSEGFKPLNLDHIYCLPTGEWSSQSLLCTIIQCEASPIVPYGKAILLNNSSYYGDYLEIKCNEGYISHTPIIRKCNELESWGELDICVEITCGNPTATENKYDEWLPVNGSTYIRVLTCPEDFYIEGSPAIILCLSNGSWSYSSAKCTKYFINAWGSSWTPSFMLIAAVGAGAGTAILILCLSVAFLVIRKRSRSQTNTTVFHLENVPHKDGIEQKNMHRQSYSSEIENFKSEVEFWSQSACTNPRKSHSALPNLPVDADPVYAQPFETATATKKTLVVATNKKDDLYSNHIYAEPVDSRKQTAAPRPIHLVNSQRGNDARISTTKTNFIYESHPVQIDNQNCDKKCAIYDSSSNSTLNSGQMTSEERYQKHNENTEFDSLRHNLEYLELL